MTAVKNAANSIVGKSIGIRPPEYYVEHQLIDLR